MFGVKSIITQTHEKIKAFLGRYFEEVGVSVLIVLVAVSSFYLGKTSVSLETKHPPIKVEEVKAAATTTPAVKSTSQSQSGGVVATPNGKRWYMPWCPSVAKLAESAKRHFASVAAAEAVGLTPAKNCAGM